VLRRDGPQALAISSVAAGISGSGDLDVPFLVDRCRLLAVPQLIRSAVTGG
jgi:hypothetical protein